MAMPPYILRLSCTLLLADLALMLALAHFFPALAHLGWVGSWLEAGLRLLVLGGAGQLLAPRGPHGAAVLLSLGPAIFLTLRGYVGLPGAAPVLLAMATPSWLVLTHGTAVVALLTWSLLVPTVATGAKEAEAWVPLRRLLALAWPEWPFLGCAFLFLALAALGETSVPYCTGRALDVLRQGDGLAAFTAAVGLMCLASASSSLFAGCRGGLFTFIRFRFVLRTRDQLFSSLVYRDLAFFQKTTAAELASRLTTDVTLASNVLALNINVMLRNLGQVLGLCAFMLGLSPRLTMLALLEVPLAVTARKVYDTRHQMLQRAVLDAAANTGAAVQESISSIEMVRVFNGEEEEEYRYSQVLDRTLRLRDQRDTERAIFLLIQRVLQLAVQALVLYCGHQQLREGTLTAGSLVAFILYQTKAGSCVQALAYSYGDLLSNAVAACKVFDYLDWERAVGAGGTYVPTRLRGHVTFHRVSFAYPTRPERLVLQDVTFELRPGEVTALAGLNGSGKSTCVALLERFYEPGAGEVLLDGVPLRDYEHRYLHRQVALVGQEPVLFSGSIRDNIAYGMEDCEEEEIIAAAKAAGALGFISALEQGFGTDVGERGGQLSAGQKQRIAIARALVRRPTVLILDEATSALDGDSDAMLQQWVRNGGDRTVLLITHQPRMLEKADRVVVLEHGTVAEMGTPAELRTRGGPYSRLLQH
ncbi:antigen peptide transporter 2 isoform X1 [Gallus gallus]|uniref:Transporter 2, ATP binding cassette subfamily B member, MHCB region n=1 Tax=Gallus gallus TaxID=9031 RepID=A5HUM1_CHICK|nr:antigen peptide transporter 2 [Gallus gallus]XP_046757457.1 antigen peptide transporter 2 isoform X1 [Gallus gallus]XP_046784516.1 antigen peptide transporter 2 isoform X1 [Gallus gallus]AEE25625.1 transporter associated with antigen presentation 2 [Gallus gallus]BAF63005.1 transporter associated with antigen processing 2 [Gallus gallus]BAG69454.1 transporter associated with antigen processing 2 [Gallus gallus]|eukprot:NP_001092827.1 antigen peptide transporter 2 [Gallus gallus]